PGPHRDGGWPPGTGARAVWARPGTGGLAPRAVPPAALELRLGPVPDRGRRRRAGAVAGTPGRPGRPGRLDSDLTRPGAWGPGPGARAVWARPGTGGLAPRSVPPAALELRLGPVPDRGRRRRAGAVAGTPGRPGRHCSLDAAHVRPGDVDAGPPRGGGPVVCSRRAQRTGPVGHRGAPCRAAAGLAPGRTRDPRRGTAGLAAGSAGVALTTA